MEKLFKRYVPEDCFSWMGIFLKLHGLSPPETRILRKLYTVLSPLFFLIIFGVPLICEPIQIIFSDDSVERKLLTVGIMNLHIASVIGIVNWLITRGDMEKIINVIRRPTFHFEIFDITDLESGKRDLDGKYRSPMPAFQKEVNFRTSKVCSCGYMIFFVYITVTISTSYTINYYQDTYEKFNPHLNKTSVYRDFVYPLWMPFDYSLSDGYYFLAFMYQPVGYFLLVGGYVVVLWVILDALIHLKSQVTIIAFALTQVDCNIPKGKFENREIIQEMRIVKCIEELQIIMRLGEKLDCSINFMLLLSFLCSLFILCCLSYLASVLSTPFQISLFASIFGATLSKVFFLCYFCQEFTSEFSVVSRNIYELDWTNYSPRLRRMMVFFLARIQNPPTITLYKWVNVDMIIYLNVVKMASSFYMLISNVNTK